MNLYHVQDNDRPMYVVATDFGDAVRRWLRQIRRENDGDDGRDYEDEDPQGVTLLATGSSLADCPELLLAETEEKI